MYIDDGDALLWGIQYMGRKPKTSLATGIYLMYMQIGCKAYKYHLTEVHTSLGWYYYALGELGFSVATQEPYIFNFLLSHNLNLYSGFLSFF